MNAMNRTVTALLAVVLLAWAPAAYAADNGTEFGIEDDLTVLGTEGTQADPDVEIRGFSLFGSSAGVTMQIPAEPGNVLFGGEVQVSSGIYVTGSSTFTQRVEVQGYGVLKSTVQFLNNTGSLTNMYFDNGAANAGKVLKAGADGFVTWEADQNTVMTFATPLRLQMVNAADDNLMDSLFLQNAEAGTNITMVSGSSMTILGDGTNGLGVSGATKLNGDTSILGANTFTVGTGLSSLGGALNVAGDADLSAKLNVDLAATFVSSVTALGSVQLGDLAGTDEVAINMATGDARADAALAVAGGGATGNYAAKFYSGADLAAWIKKK